MLKLPLEYNRKRSHYIQVTRTEFNFNNPKKKDVALYEQHMKVYEGEKQVDRLIAYEVFKIQKYPAAEMNRGGVIFKVEARESCPYDELWGRDGWTYSVGDLVVASQKYDELVELAKKVNIEEPTEEIIPEEEDNEKIATNS